jgi:hypothetical protein
LVPFYDLCGDLKNLEVQVGVSLPKILLKIKNEKPCVSEYLVKSCENEKPCKNHTRKFSIIIKARGNEIHFDDEKGIRFAVNCLKICLEKGTIIEEIFWQAYGEIKGIDITQKEENFKNLNKIVLLMKQGENIEVKDDEIKMRAALDDSGNNITRYFLPLDGLNNVKESIRIMLCLKDLDINRNIKWIVGSFGLNEFNSTPFIFVVKKNEIQAVLTDFFDIRIFFNSLKSFCDVLQGWENTFDYLKHMIKSSERNLNDLTEYVNSLDHLIENIDDSLKVENIYETKLKKLISMNSDSISHFSISDDPIKTIEIILECYKTKNFFYSSLKEVEMPDNIELNGLHRKIQKDLKRVQDIKNDLKNIIDNETKRKMAFEIFNASLNKLADNIRRKKNVKEAQEDYEKNKKNIFHIESLKDELRKIDKGLVTLKRIIEECGDDENYNILDNIVEEKKNKLNIFDIYNFNYKKVFHKFLSINTLHKTFNSEKANYTIKVSNMLTKHNKKMIQIDESHFKTQFSEINIRVEEALNIIRSYIRGDFKDSIKLFKCFKTIAIKADNSIQKILNNENFDEVKLESSQEKKWESLIKKLEEHKSNKFFKQIDLINLIDVCHINQKTIKSSDKFVEKQILEVMKRYINSIPIKVEKKEELNKYLQKGEFFSVLEVLNSCLYNEDFNLLNEKLNELIVTDTNTFTIKEINILEEVASKDNYIKNYERYVHYSESIGEN